MSRLFTLHGARGRACGSPLIPELFLPTVLGSADLYKPNGHGQVWSLRCLLPLTRCRPDQMKYLAFSYKEAQCFFAV